MSKTVKIPDANMADEQIIELFWSRDEKAIKETDKKYGRFLLRIANNILHDKLDSEECQNDTYLGVWNAIPPGRPDVLSLFLSKIMRNTAIKKYREKSRKKRIPSEMTVSMESLEDILRSDDSPEAAYLAKELGNLINDYLASLTERQRYIFIGRFYMGDKLETVSNELGVNVSTVYRETEKIKLGLKTHLERSGIYV